LLRVTRSDDRLAPSPSVHRKAVGPPTDRLRCDPRVAFAARVAPAGRLPPDGRRNAARGRVQGAGPAPTRARRSLQVTVS
jgi:hypothetical protein